MDVHSKVLVCNYAGHSFCFTLSSNSFFVNLASLPFLEKDLERLHRSLLQLVIKPDVLEKCESPAALLQIDFLHKSIYLKLKDIHFGFSTEEGLKSLQRQDKVSSTDVKAFEKEAAIMVISIVESCQKKAL